MNICLLFNFKDDFLSILSCQNRADGSQFSSGENEAEEFWMSYLVLCIEWPTENLEQMVEVMVKQEFTSLGHKWTMKRLPLKKIVSL